MHHCALGHNRFCLGFRSLAPGVGASPSFKMGWLPVTILLYLGGFIQASLALKVPVVHNHISRFADKPAAVIEGRVLISEKWKNGGYRLLADVQQLVKGRTAVVTQNRCATWRE